jgi:hypothetical protein
VQQPCPASPYVGLVPYTEADAPFFKGRDAEGNIIIENLRASRLTLLYGTSGVGKSSVLHAGVVHKLHELTRQSVEQLGEPEFAVVIFSGWRDDPIAGLMRCVQEAVASALNVKSLEPVPASSNLGDMLKAWTDRFGIQLLIILDQFEEYFQYRGDETGEGTFAFEFPHAVNRADLPAKFLISIRDDGLSRLDRFKTQLPNLFVNLLRINQMNGKAAKRAIKLPLETYNELCVPKGEEPYSIEDELVVEILKQIKAKPKLTPRTDENQSANNLSLNDRSEPASEATSATAAQLEPELENLFVETPYLQLVMTRLWEKEREEGSRVLRLDTLKRLEGLQNIIQVYLGEALNQLSLAQRRIAARSFDYLVTASGTKVAYMESDLATRLKSNYDIAPGDLREVLISLHKSRILRAVEPPLDRQDESRYEVFHDVLALAILKWQEQYFANTKAAEKAAEELAKAEQGRIEAEQKRIADEEKRREQEEKLRFEEKARTRKNAIRLLILLLLIMGGITSFALYQWGQATYQQQQATKEREEAIEASSKYKKELEDNLVLQRSLESERTKYILKAEEKRSTDFPSVLFETLVNLRSNNKEEKDQALKSLHDLLEGGRVPENLRPVVLRLVEEVDKSEADNLKKIIAQTVDPNDRKKLPVRIYIQIQDDKQRDQAKRVQERLEKSQLGNGERLVVPGIENVGGRKLSTTMLKYFNEEEKDLSDQIVAILQRLGIHEITARFIPGYSNSTTMRPKHFELWFSTDAFDNWTPKAW